MTEAAHTTIVGFIGHIAINPTIAGGGGGLPGS